MILIFIYLIPLEKCDHQIQVQFTCAFKYEFKPIIKKIHSKYKGSTIIVIHKYTQIQITCKTAAVGTELLAKIHNWGARGVMVIVAGIELGDTSSNPGLIAFHIALIPLGKVWIQLFSLQLWVNSRTD